MTNKVEIIKVAILTNIPSPYRVDFFFYLQNHFKQYEFHIVYSNRSVNNRLWNVNSHKLINSTFLNSKVLPIQSKHDTRHIQFSSQVNKVLNDLNPDIIVAFEYNPVAIQSLIWAKFNKRKFIHLTDGTLYSERNINFLQKIVRKIICRNADAFIASSSKAKEKLLSYKVVSSKIFVSFLTIDINKFAPSRIKNDKNIILYVGSMINRKGLDLLLSALGNVNADFQLNIVGNGTSNDMDILLRISEEQNIKDKIKFLGYLEGVALQKAYNESSIFVLPSREDCYGLVILEAMCCGLPVVVSKYADGAYDLVDNGENGYIIDPYNSIEFSEIITDLLFNNKKRQAMGYASETRIDKFSFSSVSNEFIQSIRYVL